MQAIAAERIQARLALVLLALAPTVRAADVGDGDRARPALARVGVPEAGKAGSVALAGDIGAGVTEGLSSSDGLHERAQARAAVAVDAARFLNLGALISGRYDLHPRDSLGKDDGFLFQSELSARLAWRMGSLGLGFEGTAWLPGGKDIGSSFSALSADGRVLVSSHTPDLVVAGFAGYRLDRSAKGVGDLQTFRAGDRSALGASDFDAVLAGIGAGYAAGSTLLFGEASAQLLLGSSKFSASPLWLTLGARRPFGPAGLSGEVSVDALASARPDSTSTDLFPIEPRVMLHVGLRYRFGMSAARTATPPEAAPEPPTPAVLPPALPKPASVELVLLDDRGQPLKQAQVVVIQGTERAPLVETEPGHYRLDDAKPGSARLRIQADGFKPIEREIQVGAGAPLHVDVHAEQALPAGQVRGLVRSFRGKPLPASIVVQPGGAQTKTDAEGFFQLDVPPGEYEVVIESPGYQPQRRKAKVDQQGVVIVNADLAQKQ